MFSKRIDKPSFKLAMILFSAVLLGNLIGCENSKSENSRSAARTSLTSTNSFELLEITDIEMKYDEFENKIGNLAKLMVGNKNLSMFSRENFERAMKDGKPLVETPFEESPGLLVIYNPRINEVYISNEDLLMPKEEELSQLKNAPKGIGKANAICAMKEFANLLGDTGVVPISKYDVGDYHVSYHRAGRGYINDPEKDFEWIAQYLFTLSRKVKGIKIHGDQITIGVHRTGKISSFRIAEKRTKISDREKVAIIVGSDDILNRFMSDIPKGVEPVILSNEIQYRKKEDEKGAVVEPMQIIRYTLHIPTEDGETIATEVYTNGYSLTSHRQPPVDFSPSAPAEPGSSDVKTP